MRHLKHQKTKGEAKVVNKLKSFLVRFFTFLLDGNPIGGTITLLALFLVIIGLALILGVSRFEQPREARYHCFGKLYQATQLVPIRSGYFGGGTTAGFKHVFSVKDQEAVTHEVVINGTGSTVPRVSVGLKSAVVVQEWPKVGEELCIHESVEGVTITYIIATSTTNFPPGVDSPEVGK